MKLLSYQKKRKIKEKTVQIVIAVLRAIFIIGVSYIILKPLITKMSSSFMLERDLFDQTVKWIPRNPTVQHYLKAGKLMNYPRAVLNSFLLTFVVSVLQILSCTMVGYGLARFNYRGSGLVFGLAIFTLVVPPQMIMIPLYLNFRFFNFFGLLGSEGINLIGSFWPFILTAVTSSGLRNGLFIYIMRQFFRGMPRALEEAAYVDGAGMLRTFVKIMLPGALPGILVIFLFAFVWQWNDYFFMNLFVGRGEDFLVQALDGLPLKAVDGDHNQIVSQYASLMKNTGSIMFIAPLLIMYLFLQKYFIESVERTGIVG
ncbi:MAG: carbohydrate ABC transporter permease [Halanaerobiaceae bacterium]